MTAKSAYGNRVPSVCNCTAHWTQPLNAHTESTMLKLIFKFEILLAGTSILQKFAILLFLFIRVAKQNHWRVRQLSFFFSLLFLKNCWAASLNCSSNSTGLPIAFLRCVSCCLCSSLHFFFQFGNFFCCNGQQWNTNLLTTFESPAPCPSSIFSI